MNTYFVCPIKDLNVWFGFMMYTDASGTYFRLKQHLVQHNFYFYFFLFLSSVGNLMKQTFKNPGTDWNKKESPMLHFKFLPDKRSKLWGAKKVRKNLLHKMIIKSLKKFSYFNMWIFTGSNLKNKLFMIAFLEVIIRMYI